VIDGAGSFISAVKDSGGLTICAVGEVQPGWCAVELFEENNKSRIAVDLNRKTKEHFSISADLLEVSLVYREP